MPSAQGSVIQVLDGLDHIRRRPDMWIGPTLHPTHLFKEVLDNAIDEIVNDYGDTITIEFDEENGKAVVCDNGRGFPIEQVRLPNGDMIDSVVAATCYTFSGSKFDSNNYNISRGTHGVGLCAVNALSTYLSFTIKSSTNPNQYHFYEFKNGTLTRQEKKIFTKSLGFSTRVEFHADPQYFKSIKLDTYNILMAARMVATFKPNSKVVVNNKKLKNTTLEQFVRETFSITTKVPLYHVHYDEPSGESVNVFFTFLMGPKVSMGEVNIGMITGGTPFESFKNIVFNNIKSIYGSDIKKDEALNGLRFFISMRVKEAKYSSQDKRLLSKPVDHLIKPLSEQVLAKLKFPYLKDFFTEKFAYKQLKIANKILNKSKGKRVSIDNPLKDCRQTPGKVLYILEGESAEGTLKAIRDSETEAILAINGKIVNTKNFSVGDLTKLLNAKKSKFKYLLESIGISLDPDNKDQKRYRYDLIRVICDADPDGLHISVLVSVAIWKFAPDLIRDKRYRIVLPPLYGANKKGKAFVPIYDASELDKYRNAGYTITRYKGLGEMNPAELDAVLKNPIEYTPVLPADKKETDQVFQLLNNSELKRKVCEIPEFSLKHIISVVNKACP